VNMKGALSEEEYAVAVVSGCFHAGTIAMTGDGSFPEQFECGLAAINKENGHGIPIIKPRANDRIVEMAKRAADTGAPAFGIDIDAAGFMDMAKMGQPVGPKTQEDLSFIKKNTSIPFIVKGIMSAADAQACLDAGVDAIVVSNHGGRALDRLCGTAEVLPHIAKVVKGKMKLLVDGGVRSGVDVLILLALGADAVLIGRPLAIGAVGGLSQGVELVLRALSDELRAAMVLTGTPDVSSVSEKIIAREM
jgi:isopentenyl diphosphate isomerase/L-lactate dehydrogenase-like FMN-dependent dehydrogenase